MFEHFHKIFSQPVYQFYFLYVFFAHEYNTNSFLKLHQFTNEQIQGAIMVASCLQVLIGSTGIIGFLLKYIGPVTIAPVVALVGIGILGPAADRASKHWGIAIL